MWPTNGRCASDSASAEGNGAEDQGKVLSRTGVVMPFGIPCETSPNPATVYNGIAEVNGILSNVVRALLAELLNYEKQTNAAISLSFQTLNRSLNIRLNQTDKLLQSIYTTLSQVLTSQSSVTASDIATAITNLSQLTSLSQQEITDNTTTINNVVGGSNGGLGTGINTGIPNASMGTVASVPSSPFFPPSSVPNSPNGVPSIPSPAGPSAPPNAPPAAPNAPPAIPPNNPNAPPAAPAPPQQQQQSIAVSINGALITLTQLCAPQQVQTPINIGGVSYLPAVSVWQQQNAAAPIVDNGVASLPLSIDVTGDTAFISIGAITVAVTLPSANQDNNPPAQCAGFNPLG